MSGKDGWCRHYRGLIGPGAVRVLTCEAGVVMRERAGKNTGVLDVLPCTGEGPVSACGDYSPYSDEELAARAAAIDAYIVRTFMEHICPGCEQKYEGKQRGPCVYCEHCGHRLYQQAYLPKQAEAGQ